MLANSVLGCVLAAGLTTSAAPLQRAEVAADPAWLVHLDCDRLRPTAIGQFIQAEMDKPEAQAKLAAFQAIVNLDLRKQLHGLTLYSTGALPADGVLLVHAEFDADRLVTLAKAAKDSQNTTYKQHVIYNWIDEDKKARKGTKPRIYAALDGARIVFSHREERVAQALDVLDGAAPNLGSSNVLPQFGAANDDSFLEAAARKLDLPASDPNAAILRLSKLIRLQVSETQRQVNATLSLEANDEEVAGNIASIAQGLVALMKLQKDKPEAAKLAAGLSLKQEGSAVVVHASLPAADALEVIKADAARKAQKKAQKAEHAEKE
jgi:hypothetical protein